MIDPVIDTDLATRLIATQFPAWRDLPVQPVEVDGWDNRTFRLGADMTVRLPSAARYAAQVAKEQRWLPRLAPHVPLPIPVPLARGAPGEGYPWPWSVYRWLEGETAGTARVDDMPAFATALARFLVALQRIAPADGPAPGAHNFFRGGSLAVYDGETREATATLRSTIDAEAVTRVWDTALATTWRDAPVWVHGDIGAANLLVRNGGLGAVIDFGSSAVGDPACDLTIAWTWFGDASRKAFRAALSLDDATWARARGWALWKTLITLAAPGDTDASRAGEARRVLETVLADHVQSGRQIGSSTRQKT